MFSTVMPFHEGLGVSGRLGAIGRSRDRISALELATLLLLGTSAAAASTFINLRLGIPGNNIIRVVFPMALGLAVVPRRGAASVMGMSAVASAAAFSLVGGLPIVGAWHISPRWAGPGAITSLALTGLLIDVALLGARPGRAIYLRLTLAGLASNMAAFLIRAGAKYFTGGVPTGKSLAVWWPEAVVTYAVCGAVAGMISAAAWFRFAGQTSRRDDGESL